MKVVLFEDEKYKNFYPITRLHTVDEIRTGRWTQKERARLQFKTEPLIFSSRKYYGDEIKRGEDFLVLNARLKDFNFFQDLPKNSCIVNKDGDILGYRGYKVITERDFDEFEVIHKELPVYNFIWEIIKDIEERLNADLKGDRALGKISSPISKNVHIKNKRNVHIGENVKLGEGVVLDAEESPIWIEDHVVIHSHSFIQGPVYIGEKSKIKPGSILDIAAIGEVVKLSGEIEESIFQGYSNKQHLGFLGHSFVGEWVNFGAGTTNSDLKNNYSKIRVLLEGKTYHTGMRFLGAIIGDHSKTAINTSINTGTIIEPFCNLFGRVFPPKYVPPFSWWGGDFKEYKFDKALETAVKVMKRRDKNLDEIQRKRIRRLFDETKDLRKDW